MLLLHDNYKEREKKKYQQRKKKILHQTEPHLIIYFTKHIHISIMSDTIILPGDKLPIDEDIFTVKTTIGPGIYKKPKTQELIPSAAGILHYERAKSSSQQLIYIESNSKRYIPHTNDYVIGIITGAIGESYKVSLQSNSTPVLLSFWAFPNASKKNRPNLKNGQAVYARVSQDIPEIETELECIDPTSGKEGGFGVLDESGYIFDVHLNFARELLFNPKTIFLETLATRCQFEIAIGINGKIWIKCGNGVKKEANDGSNNNQDQGEDQEMIDVSEENLKDLKSTLAAATFLTRCQFVTQDKLKQELNNAFQGI